MGGLKKLDPKLNGLAMKKIITFLAASLLEQQRTCSKGANLLK